MLQSQAFTTPEYTWNIWEIKYDEKLCQRYHEGIHNDGNPGSWQQGEGRLRTPLIGRTARPGGRSTELCLSFSGQGRAGHTEPQFFSFLFFFCRPITILCSRKGSSQKAVWSSHYYHQYNATSTGRAGPGESRHGSVGPDLQAIINANAMLASTDSSHQLLLLVCNGQSSEQRIEDRALQGRLAAKATHCLARNQLDSHFFFPVSAVSASSAPIYPLYSRAGRLLPPLHSSRLRLRLRLRLHTVP